MNTRSFSLGLAAVLVASGLVVTGFGNDAVLLHLADDTQQVRVEALEAETNRWMAIASGYRDNEDTGWLKIGLPEGYDTATLRVLTNPAKSPFAGKMQNASVPESVLIDYPPSRDVIYLDDSAGGPEKSGDPVIEEADIWAWEENTLYFYNQYRGLQVIDMSDPNAPQWLDYFRYPAKGEDLYSLGNGNVVLIGTGNYWSGDKLALQFLNFDGNSLENIDTVELSAGYYMDSRRYGDYLYILTREWISQVNPDGLTRNAPLIRLYTVALEGTGQDRVVDVQSFESKGWLDAVLTAQTDGILLSINSWERWSPTGSWRWRSDVHVLVPGPDGIPEEVGVAPLGGILRDKFKMKFKDGLLTTISQQADWSTGQFSRATTLENFNLGDDGFEKIGELALAPGETLFATRFYGDSVYIVTFLRIDPLFSINNTDPTKPFVAGELEIPGWSNYIEWVDQYLFAVGIESSKVTVSVFDVNDPANMVMKDRVFLNEDSWAWSEAQYDDQAISFYPEVGMLMLPFTTWSWTANDMVQAMQLISWDDAGMLELRGQIHHLDVPRRGALKGDMVVTISGRELITSDISDPDVPIEGGSTTLAWNVQHLVPHENYWLQLESPEQSYYYWRVPYNSPMYNVPKLYITPKDEPNILAAEVQLAKGRLLGVAHRDTQLVLLQDLSDNPEQDYWTIPEKQNLAIRVYDITDPMNPVMQGEKVLEVPYIGNGFDSIELSGDHVLWKTKQSMMYDYMMLDVIWPGPWYGNSSVGFVVSRIDLDGTVEIPAYEILPNQGMWYSSGGWFWESPLLVASNTTYEEVIVPESYSRYRANSRMQAFDFTNPGKPVKLPDTKLPSHLTDIQSVGIDNNYFLYFEPDYRTISVWGWDGANAFPLFKQTLFGDEQNQQSYSLSWLAPFNVRNSSFYDKEIWKHAIDVWYHVQDENRFRKTTSVTFDDGWFRDNAVKQGDFLLASNDKIHLFDVDELAGAFELRESLNLPFPNLYTMNLDAAVMDNSLLYLPAGIYGVDALPVSPELASGNTAYRRLEATISQWTELSPTLWQRVGRGIADSAGVMTNLQWLFRSDSWPVIDPDATDMGDLWRKSSWFGHYAYSSVDPRNVNHFEHGNLFAPPNMPNTDNGVFLYDWEIGYFWTSDACYPFIYAFDRQEWIYYAEGTGVSGNRWFFGLGSGWFFAD